MLNIAGVEAGTEDQACVCLKGVGFHSSPGVSLD